MKTKLHGSEALSGLSHSGAASVGRIPGLDGLRGPLILITLLVHFTDSVDFSPVGQVVFSTLQLLSVVALDVFFALSGFLITGILLDSKADPHYFRNFYARRALRIFPVYYGFLFVFFIALPRLSGRFEQLDLAQHVSYWAYLVNVAQSFDWPLSRSTGHLWSLSVEEQFYLVWPAVVYWCANAGLKSVCVSCLLVAPIVRLFLIATIPETVAFHMLFRLDVLALGGLVALAWRSGADKARYCRQLIHLAMFAFAACLVAGAAYGLSVVSARVLHATFSSACAYFAGAILVATLQAGPDSRWAWVVGSWPLQRVGIYSYAIYVLHDPLADVLTRYGILAMPITVSQAVLYCMVMIPTCIVAGALSWHLYEVQFLRLRPRFTSVKPEAARSGTA